MDTVENEEYILSATEQEAIDLFIEEHLDRDGNWQDDEFIGDTRIFHKTA